MRTYLGSHLLCIFQSCVPQAGVITDLVLLACVGIRTVLVHGGGPEINSWLEKLGIAPNFKNGLRVTDGEQARVWGRLLIAVLHELLGSAQGMRQRWARVQQLAEKQGIAHLNTGQRVTRGEQAQAMGDLWLAVVHDLQGAHMS